MTDELTTDLIGKIGEIKLPTSERTSGQAIVKADGRTHVITVNADQKLNKGTQVLIIDHLEEKDLYVVEPYSN